MLHLRFVALAVLGHLAVLTPAANAEAVRVLVAYYSQDGHTRAMADAVTRGAETVDGVEVKQAPVQDVSTDDLVQADAIVVGSPVYNANIAPEVQSFINDWPFRGGPLRDKIGAAFVTGGGVSAGEETAQLAILQSMLIFGLTVVGGPHWTSGFGASAITEEEPFAPAEDAAEGFVEDRFLRKAEGLGRRVAELATAARCLEASESNPEPTGSDDARPPAAPNVP